MAASGEWKISGASLIIEKASKEFDVPLDFFMNGIKSGKLEYRQGGTKGKQWTKVLRSQAERLINADSAGALHLERKRTLAALVKVNRDIACFKKMLAEFQEKKTAIEIWLAQNPMPS